MKITDEILEKFHQGTCSKEEQEMVELWLNNLETEELDLNEENKKIDKTEIWNNISEELKSDITKTKQLAPLPIINIAASIMVIISIAIFIYANFYSQTKASQVFAIDNSNNNNYKKYDEKSYLLTVGPNSNAKIDLSKGLLDFYGSIVFSPKEDLSLKLKGSSEVIKFKNGQSYIVLADNDSKNDIIIMNKKEMQHLSPVIQKQLIKELSI